MKLFDSAKIFFAARKTISAKRPELALALENLTGIP